MDTIALPSAVLYCAEGGSDKEYRAFVEARGTGFVVTAAWGRRGTTLQTGLKTPAAVDLPTAEKTLAKLVREKQAKGYLLAGGPARPFTPATLGSDRQNFTPRESVEKTDIRPQLLNGIDESDTELYLTGPDWWMQQKFDGQRRLIRKTAGTIAGINRTGGIVPLPKAVAEAAQTVPATEQVPGDWVLDGELVGEVFFAFDLARGAGVAACYSQRLLALQSMAGQWGGAIRLVDCHRTEAEKRAELAKMIEAGAEGVVFRRADAPYTPGRPNRGGDVRKLKFIASASCLVAGPNGDKRSVYIDLIDPRGSRVNVGKVAIPGKLPIPPPGAIIEVQYLYAYAGGCLFQPVYQGQRDDLDDRDCKIGQLKFKAVAPD